MRTGKLNALKVRSLTSAGRYGDGGGLWLQVRDADHRSWLFRYTIAGKARQMGLGPLEDVPLADARAAAGECRRQILRGVDPIGEREAARAAQRAKQRPLSFKEAAEHHIASHETNWRNAKHRAQWQATLEQHVYPSMGSIAVSAVSTGDVMTVLEPIWRAFPETASRVRGRIEAVLDYAKSREWRTGENPARWRGHIANMLPKRDRARTVRHHPALPWAVMGTFMASLRKEKSLAALALEFAILTAARTSEVTGATWEEIDLENAVWTVPASRMKAGREHRVPLSPDAAAVLRRVAELREDRARTAFVFPGARPKRPLSNMSMAMLLRRMKQDEITVHGFRSSFRDWAAEATGVAREVAEAALAHTIGNAVEAAYRRGDLFEKRRRLMEDWAGFCGRAAPPVGTESALRQTDHQSRASV